jgi:phage FluMu gp28-like protein
VTPERYFLPYQVRWAEDPARLRIVEKSRQVGLSYVDSYDSVRKAAQLPGRDVWVMSRDEIQAKQYVRYCRRWAGILKHAARDHGDRLFRLHSGRAVTVQVLAFASGASIYALSSNPDAIVGKTGHVKLDEFALHKDQRTLYAVAKPVIQWGGTLSIISTHRGVGTVFNELLTDIRQRGNRMGWSLHSIPIHLAVAQGLVEKINRASRGELARRLLGPAAVPAPGSAGHPLRDRWLAEQRAECIDESHWLQEYCCVPADESTAFITCEMIQSCEVASLRLLTREQLLASLPGASSALPSLSAPAGEGRGAEPAHPRSTLFLGVDLARKTDLCVLDLGEKIGEVVWDRLRLELKNRTFAEIRQELYGLLSLPQLRRCCLDATGLGAQLAEEAKSEFASKVEPIVFTAGVKEELAFGLRRDFEERKLRLVPDEQLRADLRGIRKEVSLGGNIRFAGESPDSHCDRFWAKALRQQAARRKPTLGVRLG